MESSYLKSVVKNDNVLPFLKVTTWINFQFLFLMNKKWAFACLLITGKILWLVYLNLKRTIIYNCWDQIKFDLTRYVMLCYAMLCYVMLCYVMLCYVMLCHVMLWSVLQHNFVISFDAYNLRNYGSQLWINFHQSILIILMLSSYFFRISKKFERNFSHIIQILANSIIKHLISTKSTCTMCFYDF